MLRSWSINTFGKTKLAAALGSALVLTLFPKAVTPVFFRLPTKPMTIHVTRNAPPKEAFDDLFSAPESDNEWKEINNSPSTDLNITASNSQVVSPIQLFAQRRVLLPVVTFNKEMISTFSGAEDMNWVAELPTAQRSLLQAAEDRTQVLRQDWTLPGWRDMAAKKISQANKSINNPKPNVYIAGITPSGKKVTREQLDPTAAVTLMDFKPKSLKISGKLRLAQGLALGDRTLEIRRFVDGIPLENGQINVQSGTFSIEVEELQGNLAVELFDKSGTIIASSSHRITPEDTEKKIEMDVAAKSQFAGTFVNFNKDPSRLVADRLSSTRGEPAEILYASLGVHDKTDALGSFVFPKISESSFGLIRSRAKGFIDGLMILGAGETKGLSLMPQHLMTSLKEIIQDLRHQNIENSGIVWGQVLFDGKPMSGVSVSVEENIESPPIYLSGFIPQDALMTTTENGYFIFVGLAKGMHSVVATRNNEYIGHMNIEVDENSVSVGNLEATIKNQSVQLKIYDAFDGTPLAANVRIQSIKEPMQVLAGQGEILLPQIHRLSYGYVQPDQTEYLPYQFAYCDKDDYIHVPLIKNAWLEWIITQKRISAVPDTGLVIGFVPEDDYEAYLSQEENYENGNIIYFDHQGRVSPQGVAGGGFIMLNVPSGTQTIVVMSKKTEMLSTQVIPVDVNSSSVLKFRF